MCCTCSWVPLVCLRPQRHYCILISFRRISLECQSKHTCSKLFTCREARWRNWRSTCSPCSPCSPSWSLLTWSTMVYPESWNFTFQSSLPKSGRGQPDWKLENALDPRNTNPLSFKMNTEVPIFLILKKWLRRKFFCWYLSGKPYKTVQDSFQLTNRPKQAHTKNTTAIPTTQIMLGLCRAHVGSMLGPTCRCWAYVVACWAILGLCWGQVWQLSPTLRANKKRLGTFAAGGFVHSTCYKDTYIDSTWIGPTNPQNRVI